MDSDLSAIVDALEKEKKKEEEDRIEEARKMDYLELAVIAAGVAVAGGSTP